MKMRLMKRVLACVMAIVLVCGILQMPGLVNVGAAGEVVADVEVTISDSSRVDNTLWFNVSSNDPFQHSVNWDYRYVALTGGVYLNGQLREDAQLIKLTGSEYIVFFENGMTPVAGTTVKVDGIFGDRAGVQTSKVKFGPMHFEYDGNSNWTTYGQEVTATNTSGTDGTFWLDVTPVDSLPHDTQWAYQYSALGGGVYVNGAINSNAKLVKLYENRYIIYFGQGFELTKGTRVKVDGIFGNASSAVKIVSAVYVYNDVWAEQEDVVDIYDSTREDSTLWFRVSQEDGLPYADDWSCRYTAVNGGVKVDGELRSDAALIKLYESEYIVFFENGLTPQKGTVVEIEGTFGNGTQSEVFRPATFIFDGNVNWYMYKDAVSYNGVTRVDKNMFFTVSPSDSLPYVENDWTHYVPIYGGVYVNGTLHSDIQLEKISANEYLICWGTAVDITSGTKVEIDGVFGDNSYATRITTPILEYKHGEWGVYVEVPEVTQTVTVNNDNRNNSGQTNSFFFTTDPSDPLEANLDWSKRYYPYSGGVYINNELNEDIPIIKLEDTLYLVYLKDYGIVPVDGMQVTISGVFGDDKYAVEYLPTTFEYRGNGEWKLESDLDPDDLTKDKAKIYDLYDFIEVSQLDIPSSNPYPVGETKNNANIAFQTHVEKLEFTMDEQDITFGLAKHLKTDVWSDSGYQVVIRPRLGQVILRSGIDTALVTVENSDVQESFDLEYGVVNLRDDNEKVVARSIYVKINGKEIISYLDANLEYTLGNYIPVYSYKMAATLGSISHKGYKLVEKEVQVQDISELHDGLGIVEAGIGSATYIGQSKDSANIGLKTKVTFNTTFDTYTVDRQDSILFAFSKEKQEIWDAGGSGYQVEIRPGQILIKCGVDTVVATYSCEIPSEFILEVGTCDVDVYKDGNFSKAYGRKVYVKIDEKEVASWMDRDFGRKLGNEVLFYQSKTVDAKLTSLVSNKYLVREENKVYDLNDSSYYAEVHLNEGTMTKLGTLPQTTELAFKTKVKMDPKSTEFKFALSKTSEKDFWDADASGWQFGFKPELGQVLLIYDTDTVAAVGGYAFPENGEFILEFGQRNVKYSDGKNYGREIYVKIDGKEVISWIDKNLNRKLGNFISAYVSKGADVSLYTLHNTVTLPVTYVVNGSETKTCDYVNINSKVVAGKTSKVVLTLKKDLTKRVEIKGFYLNDTLISSEKVLNEYSYILEKPKKGDKIRIELQVSELTVDEAQVFDIYDISGKNTITIESGKACMIGNILGENGKIGVNTAVQFRLNLPEAFSNFRVTMLGDSSGLWSYNGTMFSIVSGKARICHPLNENILEEQSSEWFKEGTSFVVEVGIVKCYEEGIYKYDRSYMKVGESADDMEVVVFYDSTQRGKYGTTVCSYGNDIPNQPFVLHSLKNIKTITDVSPVTETQKLTKILTVNTDRYAIYYPKTVVAGDSASIKFYTQEGQSLGKFTVSGKDVTSEVTASEDGAYVYNLENITSNVQFAYQITEDNTKYAITAKETDHLKYIISSESVLAGGSSKILIKADKGYVLQQVMINDTDYTERFAYDEAAGGWQYELNGIRQNVQIAGSAESKEYQVVLKGAEHADVTFSGDIKENIIPAGGLAEITIKPDKGYKIRFVSVAGKMGAVKDGTLTIESFYTKGDTMDVEVVLQEGTDSATQVVGTAIAIGSSVLLIVILGVATYFVVKKKKGNRVDESEKEI